MVTALLIVCVVLLVLCLAFFGCAYFFGMEHKTKFGINYRFAVARGNYISDFYRLYKGAKAERIAPGMRVVSLVADGDIPFIVKIGFKYDSEKFDWFGDVESDPRGRVCFATYLGIEPADFVFLVRSRLYVDCLRISWTEEDQKQPVQKSFPPHWFQRIHFLGFLWSWRWKWRQ